MSSLEETTDSASKRSSERDGAETRSALFGDGLEVSYAGVEEPVVTCDRVDIPEGEITALVGPNGSGKSTLLKALSNHMNRDAGAVVLGGREIQEYGQKELARELGLLSQENTSPGSITVEELVYHGRYPHRGFFDSVTDADRDAVERAIDRAGIDHLRDREVGDLSGGQKQLAWIGMVLAQQPEVLLLDEPTNHLDLRHQLRVMETVQRLNEEDDVTVGVVLHDVAQAARCADYLIALQDGDVYDWGPPREVLTEELLSDVFGVDAAISYTPDPQIIPKRALD